MTFDRDLVEKYGNDEKKLAELQAIRTKSPFRVLDSRRLNCTKLQAWGITLSFANFVSFFSFIDDGQKGLRCDAVHEVRARDHCGIDLGAHRFLKISLLSTFAFTLVARISCKNPNVTEVPFRMR